MYFDVKSQNLTNIPKYFFVNYMLFLYEVNGSEIFKLKLYHKGNPKLSFAKLVIIINYLTDSIV